MTQNPAGMHPADILAEITKRYGSMTALAARLGIASCSISHTIRRPVHSTKIERQIAEAIEVPLHRIWPDRWSEAGVCLRRSQRGHSAPLRRTISSQKRREA